MVVPTVIISDMAGTAQVVPVFFCRNPMVQFLFLVTLFASQIDAHEVGISYAQISLSDTDMTVKFAFAPADLKAIVSFSSLRGDRFDNKESGDSKLLLHSIFTAGVQVTSETRMIAPQKVRLLHTDDGAVIANLTFDFSPNLDTKMRVLLLEQLPRGHRQYVTIDDNTGNPFSKHILDINSQTFTLRSSGIGSMEVFSRYWLLGMTHIWSGVDHVLFLIMLLLPVVLIYRQSRWQAQSDVRLACLDTLKLITAFSVAHSITLALAVFNLVAMPQKIVELFIAFSVLLTALNNLKPLYRTSSWTIVFGFGLLHGFGFSSVLIELGLQPEARVFSMLGFNLGVEVGQLFIVVMLIPLIVLMRKTRFYRHWLFPGSSIVVILIATGWVIDRLRQGEVEYL